MRTEVGTEQGECAGFHSPSFLLACAPRAAMSAARSQPCAAILGTARAIEHAVPHLGVGAE
eukprot:6111848-Prymnesium_polylepis.1